MQTRQLSVIISFCGVLAGACSSDNNVAAINTINSDDPSHSDLATELRDLIIARSGGDGLSAFNMPASTDLSSIPQDPANPLTAEKVALGQMLFHDTAFSLDGRSNQGGTWSCATCHHAAAGFKSGVKQGIGEGGIGFGDDGSERVLSDQFDGLASSDADNLPDIQPVTSPSALNVAYQDVMLWNGQFGHSQNGVINADIDSAKLMTPGTPKEANQRRLSGVEVQAVAGLGVHRMKVDWETPLQLNAEYQAMYNAAFADSTGDYLQEAALAIAAFERTLLANESPFQRWLDDEFGVMTDAELRGGIVFFGEGNCTACHMGPALSSKPGATADEVFFAIGMQDFDTQDPKVHGVVADDVSRGRGGFTGDPADDYKFKVPQLYNLADAPVYGHGASFDSIRSVLEYKNAGVSESGIDAGQLDPNFVPLGLSEEQLDDLTAFISNALRDPNLMRYEPTSVPSGECVVTDPLLLDAGFRCPE